MEFDLEVDLDGDMTISQTESACEVEQDGGFELSDIHFDTKNEGGNTFLINKAGFKEKLSNRLSNLHFVEFNGSDDTEKIKADKKELGWTFICKSEIFEKNLTKKVLVFGKKTFP
jgi:hypothetical protein